MKIAYISKADRTGGGASLMAEELTALFNRNGHLAHHYFSIGQYNDVSGFPLYGSRPRPALFFRKIHTLSKLLGFPEIVPVELVSLFYKKRFFQYDVIHFHDLCGAVSPLTVAVSAAVKPTVWTFHDCSPFTGGCLYPMGCERFKARCSHCPQLGNWPINTKIDFTGTMQQIKRKAARRPNLTIVTPSRWMSDMAAASGLQKRPIVIPNGISTESYTPRNKEEARRKLHIPSDRFVILIIAAFLNDERKGLKYAVKALSKIKSLNPFIVVMGNTTPSVNRIFKNFDHKMTGFVREDAEKAAIFSASDVFLFSSLADNMPLVILEAMATGTPTVGFKTGGAPEMIRHGHSGYLTAPRDVDGLVQGLRRAADKTVLNRWGANARKKVEQTYTCQHLYDNHLSLYRQAVQRRQAGKNT